MALNNDALIDFWAPSNDEDPNSFGAFLVGHIGFFCINVFMVNYDLIFEFIIFNRFSKNKLTILAFIGSFCQVLSCIASIWRYNIGSPYHRTLGFLGVGFGELGMLMMMIRCMITITTIIYPKYNKYTKLSIIFVSLLSITNFGIVYSTYDNTHFNLFRPQVLLTLCVNLITSILLFTKYPDKVCKVQIMAFILFLITGMGQLSGKPILIYPGTGVMYIANTILAIYTGQRDFIDTAPHIDHQYSITSVTSPTNHQSDDDDEQMVLQRGDLSVYARIKLILSPVYEYDHLTGKAMIIPSAIRIWFYLYFMIYFGAAKIVSMLPGSELDLEDNVVKNTFGYNNICVVVDYPPWTLFGTTLWIPALLLLLGYSYFDYVCILHDYTHGKLSKSFYNFYLGCTIFEMIAFSLFTQITATAPTENAMVHTVPFLIGTFALWTMSFKHHCYLDLENNTKIFGIIYQVSLISVCIFKSMTDIPNLLLPADGKLFMLDDWKWTLVASKINDRLFLILTIILPVIFQYVFVTKLKVINLRATSKFIFKSNDNDVENENLIKIETLKL